MSLLKGNPIYDIAEIKIDRLPQSEALRLTKRLAELGYDTTTTFCPSTETYEVYGRKRYVVNNDPAETRLFNKFIDTFQKSVDLLSKGSGVFIEIDHSVGAIDINIIPKDYKNRVK